MKNRKEGGAKIRFSLDVEGKAKKYFSFMLKIILKVKGVLTIFIINVIINAEDCKY